MIVQASSDLITMVITATQNFWDFSRLQMADGATSTGINKVEPR